MFHFKGEKAVENILAFLQGCDIALSTHAYDASNIQSANHTFPSKVITYLSNGLYVVAQRLECLEKSQIGDLLYYYDKPKPHAIAEAVKKVDIHDDYDSREVIKELDNKFQADISNLLKVVEKM